MMDDEVQRSLLELDEDLKEVEEEIKFDEALMDIEEATELDLHGDDDDGDDEDLEKVEELPLPVVSKWDYVDGLPVHGLEVPVVKDDDFIQDSMFRNDFEYGPTQDPPPHVFDPHPLPTKEAGPVDRCSICFKRWTALHPFCCLPCGHVFGAQCIKEWFQTNLSGRCPQCNILCSLEDVRPLLGTPLCIPAADKGVADQEISTRRFPFTDQGVIKYNKFEVGRRNYALKKRSDANKRLAGVVRRKSDLMNRRTDLMVRRATVLNRAKALEQRGGSLCQAAALRLWADALGRRADEYLRRAKACERRAKALSQRATAYNQRVKAFEVRLDYFSESYFNLQDDLQKNTTHCAAAATCHKD